MSAEADKDSGSFDLAQLRELISLMEQHGLTEINLRQGTTRWQLRRSGAEQPQWTGMPYPAFAPPPMPVAPMATVAPAAPVAAAAPVEEGILIKAPTVGTFYASPTPNDPTFVSVGSKIGKDTVVCIIEAMKVFNQIPAEVNGTILEVLCKNGDAVEFGQPLFRVKP